MLTLVSDQHANVSSYGSSEIRYDKQIVSALYKLPEPRTYKLHITIITSCFLHAWLHVYVCVVSECKLACVEESGKRFEDIQVLDGTPCSVAPNGSAGLCLNNSCIVSAKLVGLHEASA